ncbi:hypothetical protein BV25DRAFT_1915381 [Artomyces pyxidatus]|uniref:Uncharacterized protein n=1 Tax=Artomyces pyxidatus TaxID=48021 RepID=A0ACB8T3I0_9AGAM|nr:hypothetical protein BV25DRAFT_1915381 [Artomyces pyxidatus]
MPSTSRKKQPAAGAGAALTPAQKGAATRKANREKREAAAAAVNSPEAGDEQDDSVHNEAPEPHSARGPRPRRVAASTAAKTGQGDEGSTRKRAASSAEPRGTDESAKKAPKQRKSDAAIASHNDPMEVDEDGRGQEGSPTDSHSPAVEQLQITRPWPSNARQDSPATQVNSVPPSEGPALTKAVPCGEARAGDEEDDEEEAAEDADAVESAVEGAHASDEAEGDEQWAGTEEPQDQDAPSKKTTKALARQFEQAARSRKKPSRFCTHLTAQTPIWARKGKGPALRRSNSPPPQGRHEDTRARAPPTRSVRETRWQDEHTPTLHTDQDQALERVQDNMGIMNIDVRDDGRSDAQPDRRRPAASRRRQRIESSGEDVPTKVNDTAIDDVDVVDDRERQRQLIRVQADSAPSKERDRAVDKARQGRPHPYDDERLYNRYSRAHGEFSATQPIQRQPGGRNSTEERPVRTHGRPYGGGDRFHESDQDGSKHGYGDQGSNGSRHDRHANHDYREYDRGDHHGRARERERGATRSQHTPRPQWNDAADILEIYDSTGSDDQHQHKPSTKRAAPTAMKKTTTVRVDARRTACESSKNEDKGEGTHGGDETDEGVEGESEDSQEDDGLPRDGQWLGSTKFNMGDKGRPMLAGQFERVANVISYTCATEVPKFVCFQDAFPLADDRIPLYRTALMKGARATKLRTIFARLESETAYVEKMAIIPEGRVSIFRGKVRDKAAAGVKMHYRFSSFPAHDFTGIISKLLENRRHIFPGDAVKRTIEEERPYCHSSIIYIIHESFFGGNPVKKFPVEYYPLSPRTKKRQLPKSMVALAATANEAALMAYRMGPTAVKIAFYGDTFDDVFSVHLATLDSIYDDDAEIYDGLMTYLYEQASGEASRAGPSSLSRRGEQIRPISIITANMAKRFK